jgi:RHS repeat-associated protein
MPEGFNNSLMETENKYLYNGKEFQDELNLNWYDYGARMYEPGTGRWISPDPLTELEFSLTPYRYCFNNPINFIDPFGLWDQDANGNWSTKDAKDIERFVTYLQAESEVLNNNPSIEQVSGFIEGEESEAGLGKLSNGSNLLSTVTVNGYNNGGHTNWYADNKSLDNAWHEVQGNLTPDALDPRTVGQQPLFGLTYPGPNNPKTYSGKDDYSYVPSNLAEYPAIGHDRRYDNLGIKGASGLFADTRSIGADWKFVGEEFAIA